MGLLVRKQCWLSKAEDRLMIRAKAACVSVEIEEGASLLG
jgi:hypothetical protein